MKADLQRLENGDTVQVPPIGPQVTVEGMVRRPAVYELREEKTLASVLELAGGLLPAAALRHVEVQRLVAHDKQTMLSLDIPEIEQAAEVTSKLESFEIQDGDRIRIYPIAPYNQDAIFIEGHVVRPGRYSYRAGMRVTDVLSSYKDLLPEPAAQYAEIIRLNAPDFHPSVESFDLAAALEKSFSVARSSCHGYGSNLQPVRFRKSSGGFRRGRRTRPRNVSNIRADSAGGRRASGGRANAGRANWPTPSCSDTCRTASQDSQRRPEPGPRG